MNRSRARLAAAVLVQATTAALAITPSPACAQEVQEGDAVASPGEPEGPTLADLAEQVRALRRELASLRERADMAEEDATFEQQQRETAALRSVQIGGYVDVGAFYVGGNGSGVRSDTGHERFPEYRGAVPDSWVFMGDPLSTAINSRGEPADTGDSLAIAFDSVDSRGAFSFLINTATLTLIAPLGSDALTANARVDFVPRRRDVSDPTGVGFGDFIDVRLAYLEQRVDLGSALDITFQLGKFDSVLGVEYRRQDAPDRTEVTPSLLCRYTCGRPIGLKARVRFLDDRALVLNLSVTSGSHFAEGFPFNADVDLNRAPTGAGRLSYRLPIGAGIEIGVSGAVGAQDMQDRDDIVQWHVGADLLIEWDDLVLAGEFVQGEAPGATEPGQVRCGLAPCLRYRGAYGRVGYRFLDWLLPYVRVDWREALHQHGAGFVYVSELIRATAGFRFDITEALVLKLEYTLNFEIGRIPQFPNDVATASLVGRF